MDVDKTIRLGGRCSVWGCDDPIVAEALCSAHLAFNCPPKAPGPESTVQRPLHKPRRTRRFALGRASARPAKTIPQQIACSPNQTDAALAHFRQKLPTRPATHQLSNLGVSNSDPVSPPVSAPTNTAPSRQYRATVEDVNISTTAVDTTPTRPREPYFVLHPDISSIDKNLSAFPRQEAARDLPESRFVSKNTSLEGSSALVDGLVQAGLEFASTLRFSFVQMTSATRGKLLSANPSARVGDSDAEELPAIIVADTPSRKRPDPVNSHRREASTLRLFQEAGQHSEKMKDIPLQLPPKKRKADAADVQPSAQESSRIQRIRANSTSSAPERQTRSQSSAQLGDGNQTTPSKKPFKPQSSRLSDDQATNHLRNSKRLRTSNDPAPVIETSQAKSNGQLENIGHARCETPDGSGGHGSTPISQEPQQPEPYGIGSMDERESITVPPLPTPETDVTVEEDQTTPAARQSAAQELTTAKRRVFDSEAFDAMVYRQSSLRPPAGVSRQSAARPKTPTQVPSTRDQRQYLAVNPAIHMAHNRSDEWYKQKALEIQGRGGRKAWFGKVIERRRWIRAKERAEEEEQKATKASKQEPKRMVPQPWSYDRIMDFGDVPEEELPEDVLQNPAWVKACAWHRENEAKRVLRDRAAREAHREAWSYAESIKK